MIGLLKYGSGLPFNRLEALQGHLAIPLPASTQWDIVAAIAENLAPAFAELIRQAAQWLTRQLDEKLAKPNAAIGGAIRNMLKHWEKLTLFLRQAGAPLDNNVCERALKKAILHRKNALFYKTRNGTPVGDLFMSLIYTCQLNEANPFDYLTELQRHPEQLVINPERWMPWNYRESLA